MAGALVNYDAPFPHLEEATTSPQTHFPSFIETHFIDDTQKSYMDVVSQVFDYMLSLLVVQQGDDNDDHEMERRSTFTSRPPCNNKIIGSLVISKKLYWLMKRSRQCVRNLMETYRVEICTLLIYGMEYTSMCLQNASISESFFGLQRARTIPDDVSNTVDGRRGVKLTKLRERDRRISASFIALEYYCIQKYQRMIHGTIEKNLLSSFKLINWLIRLRFVLKLSHYPNLSFMILRMILRRNTLADSAATSTKGSQPSSSNNHHPMDILIKSRGVWLVPAASIALVTAIQRLRKRLFPDDHAYDLPVPLPSKEQEVSIIDGAAVTNQCPICHHQAVVPSLIVGSKSISSNIVGCYNCYHDSTLSGTKCGGIVVKLKD